MATATSYDTILGPVYSLASHCVVSMGRYQQTLLEEDSRKRRNQVKSYFTISK